MHIQGFIIWMLLRAYYCIYNNLKLYRVLMNPAHLFFRVKLEFHLKLHDVDNLFYGIIVYFTLPILSVVICCYYRWLPFELASIVFPIMFHQFIIIIGNDRTRISLRNITLWQIRKKSWFLVDFGINKYIRHILPVMTP